MANFPIAAGQVIEVRVYAYFQGSVIMNVYHYQVDESYTTEPNGDAALRAWVAQFEITLYGAASGIVQFQSSNLIYNYMEAQIVASDRYYYVTQPMGYAGSQGTGQDLPSDTQLCVTYRNQTVGRGRAGRKNYTGFKVSQFLNAYWTGAFLAAWNAGVINLMQQDVDNGLANNLVAHPVIWSPSTGSQPGALVECQTNPEVRIMRRRQVGIGA